MSHHIQKTIQFNDEDLKVYYQETTHNNHHVWTDNSEDAKSFTLSDANSVASTIGEATTIVER